MDPLVKALLNSLRCPLCKGQMDLKNVSTRKKDFNFFCVNNFEHYAIFLNHWNLPPKIEEDAVIIYEKEKQFRVYQQYFSPDGYTQITVRETDLEGRLIENSPPSVFSYNKNLFDFAFSNQEKILNRIKTILVFQ